MGRKSSCKIAVGKSVFPVTRSFAGKGHCRSAPLRRKFARFRCKSARALDMSVRWCRYTLRQLRQRKSHRYLGTAAVDSRCSSQRPGRCTCPELDCPCKTPSLCSRKRLGHNHYRFGSGSCHMSGSTLHPSAATTDWSRRTTLCFRFRRSTSGPAARPSSWR